MKGTGDFHYFTALPSRYLAHSRCRQVWKFVRVAVSIARRCLLILWNRERVSNQYLFLPLRGSRGDPGHLWMEQRCSVCRVGEKMDRIMGENGAEGLVGGERGCPFVGKARERKHLEGQNRRKDEVRRDRPPV